MQPAQRAEFDKFVRGHGQTLLRAAYYLTGDWDQAQDALQSALVNLCVRWGKLRSDVDTLAYARRCVINACHDEGRRRRRQRSADDKAASLLQPQAAAAVDVEERNYLQQLLQALPARQREVIVLRFLEDMSTEDTAVCMGVRTGTVKSQTHEAVRALRNAMTVRGTT